MARISGVYLNLVEGLLWVQDVVRSNRITPTDAPARESCSMTAPVLSPGGAGGMALGHATSSFSPRASHRSGQSAPIALPMA